MQCIDESICLTLAFATHTKKIKSFDGKRGGSHEMLISDVCHNYQFKPFNTIGSCIFVKNTILCISVGRCVIPCAFFGKSVKHTFSRRKMYPVEEKRCLQFFFCVLTSQ